METVLRRNVDLDAHVKGLGKAQEVENAQAPHQHPVTGNNINWFQNLFAHVLTNKRHQQI